MIKMQRAVRLIFPPQCLSCDAKVELELSLCPVCWRDNPFISGLVCNVCGVPLRGESDSADLLCDDCMVIARPWRAGRAALLYQSNARRLVLGLKHGDRLDLVRPAVNWMIAAAQPLLRPNMVVVPVPLYWIRLLKRRYNQAALLAQGIARQTDNEYHPQALLRLRRTLIQDGMHREQRFQNMAGAIAPNPKYSHNLKDRDVLLVDEVMTSGATLAAAKKACYAAGASRVSVVVLARVAKNT